MTASLSARVESSEARIDAFGMIACQKLTMRVEGRRIVLAGPVSSSIVAAAMGLGQVRSGRISLQGHDIQTREHIGYVGIAPLDPPLPSGATVLDILELSATLYVKRRRSARETAHQTVEDCGLTGLAKRRVESLSLAERRVVVLAQALIPNAQMLLADCPLYRLESQAAQDVLTMLGTLAKLRPVVATTRRVDASTSERQLMMGADQVAVVSKDGILWQGTPQDMARSAKMVFVQLQEGNEAFLQALGTHGIEVRGGPTHLSLGLPDEYPPSRLFETAATTRAVMIEITPIW